jgi:hypothetical protein
MAGQATSRDAVREQHLADVGARPLARLDGGKEVLAQIDDGLRLGLAERPTAQVGPAVQAA